MGRITQYRTDPDLSETMIRNSRDILVLAQEQRRALSSRTMAGRPTRWNDGSNSGAGRRSWLPPADPAWWGRALQYCRQTRRRDPLRSVGAQPRLWHRSGTRRARAHGRRVEDHSADARSSWLAAVSRRTRSGAQSIWTWLGSGEGAWRPVQHGRWPRYGVEDRSAPYRLVEAVTRRRGSATHPTTAT